MWDSDQARGLDYPLQWFGTGFSWYGNMIACLLSIDLVRVSFEQNICKGGRQELKHSGRIVYHLGRDGDEKLVFQDISCWWVFGDVSGRVTGVTTWRGDLLLYFDFQVWDLFLFHLIAWSPWDPPSLKSDEKRFNLNHGKG